MAVVCDSLAVSSHAFLRNPGGLPPEHGGVRTAFEYLDIVPELLPTRVPGGREAGLCCSSQEEEAEWAPLGSSEAAASAQP